MSSFYNACLCNWKRTHFASHPFDSIKRSKSQELRKLKSKPVLLACGHSLNVTIFQFHGGFQVIPKNNPTLPTDDSQLWKKIVQNEITGTRAVFRAILVVNSVSCCLSFFLTASSAATYNFTAPVQLGTIITLEPCALNVSFSISYWDLIIKKFFTWQIYIPLKEGMRGEDRQGEDRQGGEFAENSNICLPSCFMRRGKKNYTHFINRILNSGETNMNLLLCLSMCMLLFKTLEFLSSARFGIWSRTISNLSSLTFSWLGKERRGSCSWERYTPT
jgi:hypothetical protein